MLTWRNREGKRRGFDPVKAEEGGEEGEERLLPLVGTGGGRTGGREGWKEGVRGF